LTNEEILSKIEELMTKLEDLMTRVEQLENSPSWFPRQPIDKNPYID